MLVTGPWGCFIFRKLTVLFDLIADDVTVFCYQEEIKFLL